jgi:MFS family permease
VSRSVLLTLRALLALLFAAALAAQLLSGTIAQLAPAGPLAAITAVLVVSGALCVQVVLVSVWMLVAMVQGDRIFDDRGSADRWVTIAIGALLAGAALAVGGVIAVLVVQLGEPAAHGWPLALAAAAAAGVSAALALLVLVMRRLLHTAIQLRSELAEVI